MEEHHQHKLQQVLTTMCVSGVFAPVDGSKGTPVQGARSGPASGHVGAGCSNNMQLQPPPSLTRSGPAQVPNAAINATCTKPDPLPDICPYASCIDCCIRHCNGTHAGPDLVGGGGSCSCMLLLHPVPNCPDAGPIYTYIYMYIYTLVMPFSLCWRKWYISHIHYFAGGI